MRQGPHRKLALNLCHEGGANKTRPHDSNSQGQLGKVEAAVHGSQRAHRVLLVDQHCDVILAAALGDGPAYREAHLNKPAHLPLQSPTVRCTHTIHGNLTL